MADATYTEILTAAKNRLAEVLENPKPTYKVDDQEVSWTEYADMLRRQVESLQELVDSEEEDTIPLIQTTSHRNV